MVIAFYSIFIDDSTHGISHIKDSSERRREMANASKNYNLKKNRNITLLFDQFVTPNGSFRTYQETNDYVQNYLESIKNKKKARKEEKKAKRLAKKQARKERQN